NREPRGDRVVRPECERDGRLIEVAEYVVAVFRVLDPLRTVHIMKVPEAAADRQEGGGTICDERLRPEPPRPFVIRADVEEVPDAERLPIVPFNILPVGDLRVAVRTGPAAGRAVVERLCEHGQTRARAPVVGKLPMRVDIAAKLHAVAAVVPACPLIQVPPEIPQVL